jgi:hypothetical protein
MNRIDENERLNKMKRKRGEEVGGVGDASPEHSGSGSGGSMSPPFGGAGGTSRIAQIMKRFKRGKQAQANGELGGDDDASDEGEEDDQNAYTTYAGVLDDADYNREEEIGDYKTGYSLAGGVEALEEEEEEIILREENNAYMEHAYNQLLAAQDTSKPVDWYGDPSIGAPVRGNNGLDGAGEDAAQGVGTSAIREYDGVLLRMCTMPPVFKAPRAPGFAPGQSYLAAKGKMSHGFSREGPTKGVLGTFGKGVRLPLGYVSMCLLVWWKGGLVLSVRLFDGRVG